MTAVVHPCASAFSGLHTETPGGCLCACVPCRAWRGRRFREVFDALLLVLENYDATLRVILAERPSGDHVEPLERERENLARLRARCAELPWIEAP